MNVMALFTLLSIFFLSLFVFLIPNVIWAVAWLVAKCVGCNIAYTPAAWCGAVLVLILWGSLVYGYYVGRYKLKINNIEYANNSLPQAFDGYRIVHISDLHLDSFKDNLAPVERVVDSINAQNPDLVCFTGDIVNLNPDAIKKFMPVLARIKAKDGVVSVLGNHDFFIYSREFVTDEQRDSATAEIVEMQRAIGWKVLRNENTVISRGSDSITIIGVDNINMGNQGFRTVQRGDLKKAMEGASGYAVLLTHDPTHWRFQVLPDTDIQLTLSGHTHAAQLTVCGWTPASLMFKDAMGARRCGNQMLYVNAGIGCTIPMRVGASQEITVISLSVK